VGSLRAALETVPDVRRGQGRVHALGGMLALSVCALLCGCRSLYAISQWGQDCGPELRDALGLRREGEGIAAGVLERRGLRLEQVRAAVLAELARLTPEEARVHELWESRAQSGPLSGPKNNVITCRLDDRAVEALDALVEAGIRSTRSDAAAWLIDAGVEAHRPLFDRVEATIAEIRRLRAEAQQIARQVTAGGALMGEAAPAQAADHPTEPPASPDAPTEQVSP
jgi:hypothetical protein